MNQLLLCSLLFLTAAAHKHHPGGDETMDFRQDPADLPQPEVQHRFGESIISQYRLDNGLTIIIWEDHAAPVAAYNTWFAVGSGHEPEGATGMAHLFEHLMFKETANLKAGEFDRILEANGVSTNAATWLDWTYYREHLPSDKLDLVIRLEADRMANMVLNQQQLDTEREVVRNERRLRVDNDPDGKAQEVLYNLHFGRHPYGHPTIGWMQDLDAMKLEDCLSFRSHYYAPSNATIVVVGDVDTANTLRLIKEHYSAMEGRELPAAGEIIAPPRRTEQHVEVLRLPVAAPSVTVLYPAPPALGRESAPLQVIAETLFNLDSASVRQILVEREELAVGVSGWYGGFRLAGAFEIQLSLVPGSDWQKALELLDAEIERFRAQGCTDRELVKGKNNLELGFLRTNMSVAARARNLGHFHTTTRDFRNFPRWLDRILAVTPAEVQAAATGILRRDSRTIVVVLPQEQE